MMLQEATKRQGLYPVFLLGFDFYPKIKFPALFVNRIFLQRLLLHATLVPRGGARGERGGQAGVMSLSHLVNKHLA